MTKQILRDMPRDVGSHSPLPLGVSWSGKETFNDMIGASSPDPFSPTLDNYAPLDNHFRKFNSIIQVMIMSRKRDFLDAYLFQALVSPPPLMNDSLTKQY